MYDKTVSEQFVATMTEMSWKNVPLSEESRFSVLRGNLIL